MKTLIKVVRIREVKGKKSKETAYFISSLASDVDKKIFFAGIRNHWGIESYHYLKDTTFREDRSKVVKGNAPANISIMKNVVLNILRGHGEGNIAQSIRMVAHEVGKLWRLITE